MGAVTAQQPAVVNRHDDRQPRTQTWQGTEVEIIAMQIVQMQDVWSVRGHFEQMASGGIIEIFLALFHL